METIVFVTLEEVRVSIGVSQCGVQIIGYSFPVGDGFGVAGLNGWPLGGIETPEFAALEEIDLAIASPDHGRVQMIGNASESLADLLGICAVHLIALIAPVLGALEEVRLAISIRECRINVAGQSWPALGYQLGVTLLDGVCGQLIVFVALEGIRITLCRVEQRINLGVLANRIIQRRLGRREGGTLRAGRVDVGGRQWVALASIERLYGKLVIVVQLKDGLEATIEGRHQCRRLIRMRKSQGMTELVSCHLEEIGAAW